MNKKILIPIALLSSLFLYLTFDYLKSKEEDKVYYGTTYYNRVKISPEISGKLLEISKNEGDFVEVGDILGKIDNKEYSVKAENSALQKEISKNNLEKVEDGARSEEIAAQSEVVNSLRAGLESSKISRDVQRNNLATLESNYKIKEKNYSDTLSLFDKGFETKTKLDLTKLEFENAKKDYLNFKNSITLADLDIANKSAALNAGIAKLELLKNGADKNDKEIAKNNLEISSKLEEISDIYKERGVVTSSVKGIIEAVNYRVGEVVNPNSKLISLIENSKMYLKIYVHESILPTIKVGDNLNLTSDYMSENITGKIIYISPVAEFTPMNIVTKKDRMRLVYEVKIEIEKNETLKAGMMLSAKLGDKVD